MLDYFSHISHWFIVFIINFGLNLTVMSSLSPLLCRSRLCAARFHSCRTQWAWSGCRHGGTPAGRDASGWERKGEKEEDEEEGWRFSPTSVLNLRASSQILRWKMINCVTLDNRRQAAHGRGVLIDRRDSIRGGGGGGATAAASTPDGGWSRPKWTLRFHADTSLHFGDGTDQVAPVSFLFELLDRPSFSLWKKAQSLGEFHFVFAWKVRLR